MRVLLVDDEPAIRRTLRANFTARGYEVSAVETGKDAIEAAVTLSPDLIVLDLMLPDMSGLDVCRDIRAVSSVPILVLSARGEERAKVRALDLGADDYVTKPFGVDELLARARALLRRQPMTTSGGVLRAVDIEVDLDAREARKQGQLLTLTAREFEVLAFLVRHAGRVVTHRMLLAEVWGPEYGVENQYLRVFINRLRRVLEDDPAHPRYIQTDPGVGYRFLSSE